jgi:hypothetical protein
VQILARKGHREKLVEVADVPGSSLARRQRGGSHRGWFPALSKAVAVSDSSFGLKAMR